MTSLMATSSQFPLPEGLQGFWQWDKMHCPRPQTELTQELFNDAVSEGFSSAMDELACPVGIRYRAINYYGYMAVVPQPLGAETQEQRVSRYQAALGAVLPRIGELWEREWLPSIIPGLDKAKGRDYQALTDAQLLEVLEEMRQEFVHRYVVHGKINFVTISASQFADFYNEAIAPDDHTEPYEALQGFPTRSLDAGRGLWRLSRIVKNNPELSKQFSEGALSSLPQRLEKSEPGRAFLREFQAYLDEFGWRSDVFELSDLTWREDPGVPLNTIQGYLQLKDDANPDERYRQSVHRRERLLEQARSRLKTAPERLAQFNQLYEMACHYLTITEDHNYYIDQVGNAVMRLPTLELGRRLAAKGALADANDVFHLFNAEIREGLQGRNLKELAAQRKAAIENWGKVIPPPIIGEPPPPNEDPMAAAIGKMFGVPPEPSRDPNIIAGRGASPGVARGRAKVIRSLAEASKLEPGDILVCEMTMPPWTPLFSIAGAVVADTGGVLSHCAIVSREYRLPCVVSAIIGTAVIQDGMLLTVDGSKGIVRIESRT